VELLTLVVVCPHPEYQWLALEQYQQNETQVLDPQIASRLTGDFEQDTGESKKVTLEEWQRRPLSERLMEMVGWIFEREQ